MRNTLAAALVGLLIASPALAVDPWGAPGLGLASVAGSVAAAGTTLPTAQRITADLNTIATCASGAGVALDGRIGHKQDVVNAVTANACLVYPPTTTSTINGGTAGAAVSLAAATSGTYPHGLFWCSSVSTASSPPAFACVQAP